MNNELPIAPLGELPTPPPTYGDTLSAAVERPIRQAQGAVANVQGFFQLSTPDERKIIADKLDVLNQTLGDPRISNTQAAADTVAEMGASLFPTAPFAAVGGLAAKGLGIAAGWGLDAVLPEGAMNFLRAPLNKVVTGAAADYLPGASIASVAQGTLHAYGAYKGMIIPEHIVNNYNKTEDTLNGNQAITDWAKDNYGFLLPAPLLAGGYLLYKMGSFRGQAARLLAQHEQIRSSRARILAEFSQKVEGNKKLIAAEEARLKSEGVRSDFENNIDSELEAGNITKEDHEWLKAYLENPNDDKKLFDLGKHILPQLQLPIDRATGRLWMEWMDSKSIKQMNNALTDRLGSDHQASMMDYITNNRIDVVAQTIQRNPSLMQALKGMMVFADKKLASREKVTKAAKKLLQEHVFVENPNIFDRERFPYLRLEEHNKDKLKTMERLYELRENPQRYTNALQEFTKLMESSREKYPDLEHEFEYLSGNMLSQENIYKHLLERGYNPKNFPMTLPSMVREKLSLRKRLAKASDLEEIKRLTFRDKQLEFEKIPKEIERIVNEMEGKLPPNYKQLEDYKRLEDLADYRDDAKQAIAYLDMIHEYNKQEAMTNAVRAFVDMADSNVEKFADPNKVIRYLKSRAEQTYPKLKEVEVAKQEAKIKEAKSGNKPETPAAIKIDVEEVKSKGAEEIAKDVAIAQDRLSQFKENSSLLEEAVKCAWEQMNG